MRSERVVCAAVLVLAAMTATRAASADEPSAAAPAVTTSRLDLVRRDLVAGRLPEAARGLSDAEAEGIDPGDRIAAMQLRFVADAWTARGRIPPATRTDDDDSGDAADWHVSLARARSALIAGDYVRADARLAALTASAPDAPWASAAHHLARLAHEMSETPGETPATPTTSAPRSRWYGWQTLMCDGISLVTSPVVVGLGGYVLAAPITHLAHGAPVRAAASLGLRILLPVSGVFIGTTVDRRGELAAVAGGLLGVGAAIAIDAAVVAYEPANEQRTRTRTSTLAPSFGPRMEGGFDVGLGGRF